MKKLIILFALFGFWSCTDLDEEVFDTIVNENFYQTEKQVLAAAGPAYNELRGFVQVHGVWGINCFSSDEAVLPKRGIHWDNGGMYKKIGNPHLDRRRSQFLTIPGISFIKQLRTAIECSINSI